MPLITMDLIRFPEFCSQYYKTIALFASMKSHKITQLNPELFQQLLSSVQLGLNTFTTDIQGMCFEYISSVASAVYFDRDPSTSYYAQLQPFLPLLFKMIFERQIDQDNKCDCYGALFLLACIYKENFYGLMQQLIENEQNPLQKQKIQNESVTFMTSLELVNNRAMKTKFVEKLDKFVTNLNFIGRQR